MRSKSKRLMTALMAVVMLLSVMTPISAFAADVTMDLSKAEVSWDYTLTDADGNAFTAAYGLTAANNPFGYAMGASARKMHDYTAKAPGLTGNKSDWEYGKDYVYCFCIEHGIPLPNSNDYSASSDATHGNKYEMLSTEQKNLLSLALAYGYPNRTDLETSKDANACYSATQLIVWQITMGFRSSPTELNDKTYPMDGYSGTMTEQYTSNKYLKEYYDLILSDMATHYTRPSFTSNVPASAKTYEMDYVNGKYTVTLTDTNNVLSKYRVSSNGGASVSVNGNTLTISSTQPLTDSITIKLNRRMPSTTHTTGFLIWSVPGKEDNNQDMVSGVPANNDPVPSYLKVATPAGSVKIVKDSEDGVVDGITFTITGNGVNQTVTTKNGGVIQVDNLRPGTYTVTEQSANYYEPQKEKTVTVVSGQTATVSFSNVLKRGDLTVTKTAEDGLTEGIKFRLTGTSDSGVKIDVTATVDSSGKAYFKDILIGSGYLLEEVDTALKYIVPDSQDVEIEWDKVATAEVYNELKRGDLKVIKTSEDSLVEGMKFHLYGTSLSGEKVDEYAYTDKNGVALFKDILIGENYTVEEVNTAIRYVIPESQGAVIEWNKVTEVKFHNVLKKWRADVFKLDADLAGFDDDDSGLVPVELMPMALSLDSDAMVDDLGGIYGQSQGDATLEGAVYGVFKDGALIDTYTTDKNGYFLTDYYPCYENVEWTIREISPSEGYLLDDTVYYIDTYAGQYTVELNTVYPDVYEDIIKGKITIIKHTDDGSTKIETPEVGAMFEIYLKSAGGYEAAETTERDILTCDEFGYAETIDLPYGVYVVKQIKGWDGRELLDPFEVFVSEDGEIYRYLINNANFESYLHVVKTDSTTGKTIPYAGAGFQIYAPDGSLVTMSYTYPTLTVIDTFYTDENGTLITPEKLPYGEGYYLVEVQAPHGYVLDATPIYFDVTEENSADENGITIVKVVKENEPQKGTITITKTGEVFSSVVESDGVYRAVYEIKGLAGAVYEITAAEDVVTLDGTLRYKKGDVVATITTGADGTATTEPLFLGKFEIREITAPHGMILNGDTVTVELTYAGQEIKITTTSAAFVNERQKVEIDLSKVLEQDEKYGIGMNGEITSVKFGLFATEDITAADGKVIPKNGLIETVTCDENGKAVFATDLPVGAKVYVKEIATDNHYILSDSTYPVTFEYAGQDTVVVKISVNNGEAITNEIIRGTIIGKKLDEDGFTICGAIFGLFRENETEFTEETALATCQSNEIGIFTFENVPFGRWIVREIKAAPAFVLNENSYAVTVGTDEEVIEITIENEFITGSVKTTKVDKEYPDNKLSGAVFEVYVDVDNNGEFDPEIDLFVGEMTETEDGIYEMHDLRYNGYFLHEKTAPEGFLKDDGYHYFEIRNDGETVIVENEAGVGFTNQPILGNVTTTKVDKEYPDNRLSGAVFEIYKDVDGNGEFDAEIDTLVGEMTETEAGVYLYEKLRYGGYFLYEKTAPEGFVKDDTYHYFEIRNDGETVIVENEAGVGFTNKPIVGELELTKTDISDGKVLANVGFRIRNEAGEIVAEGYTDENGIAKFTLRYGKYTYEEFAALDGYIPDTKAYPFEIKEDGEIVKAAMTNEKIPEVPQTGDESNIGFWIGLAAVALGGVIATAIVLIKKKKDDENE